MTGWLDVPLGRRSGTNRPTWGSLAERFERCRGRVEFYVGRRVHDPRISVCIVIETLESNLDLLIVEHDELEELRRLRATVDRLIASYPAARDRRGRLRLVLDQDPI
jgi:hypothetical protein